MKTLHMFAVAGIVLGVSPAMAQTQRSGNDSARVAQQLQQSAAERAELQAQITALKSQNDELKKKLDKATADQQSAAKRARDLETTVRSRDTQAGAHATEELEKNRTQLQELIGRFRKTAKLLKDVEQDRNEARGQLKAGEAKFNMCASRNIELASLANEVLDRYEHKGIWKSAAQKEPFTQITRTRIENMVDEYRARIDDLTVPAAQNKPAPNGG